jgi:ABC-type glycerol-3-phosphate transport system substrate-binding protein
MRAVSLILIVATLFLAGCSLFDDGEAQPEDIETPTIPTPSSSPTPEQMDQTPEATEPSPVVSPTSLNIWIVSEFAPGPDLPSGNILAEQIDSFRSSHPELSLNIEFKDLTVQGGTLSYLRTGRDVASSILPDLIILPDDQLRTFSSEQLIYPLDDLITQEMIDDLFPAAQPLSLVDNTTYGYPFTLTTLQHVAYNTIIFSDTLPSTWDTLLAVEETAFVFPAAGPAGAQMALQLYLESGGDLGNDPSQPQLQVEPLANALSQFSRGRTEGFITIQSSNLTTLSESWQVYVDGGANIVQTEATLYLREQAGISDTTFAAGPGLERPIIPLVSGWVWAISTPDLDRQELSAQLLTWLSSSENMGQWSMEAQMLPSRRSAFEYWENDPYTTFLRLWLERALPFPEAANSEVMTALGTAVFDVITLAKSPQVAAEEAATSLQ